MKNLQVDKDWRTGLPLYDVFVAVVHRAKLDAESNGPHRDDARLFLSELDSMVEMFRPSTVVDGRGRIVSQ